MRTLLNTMRDRGWLTWEAEIERGKRSRLTFLYTGLALQQRRAEDLLVQDHYRPTSAVGWRQSDCAANAGFHLAAASAVGGTSCKVLYYRPLRVCYLAALRRSGNPYCPQSSVR